MEISYDVAVIGAGASGLVCARSAAKRNRRVVVIDHNKAPGKKILMSGGGRCNFTNRRVTAEHFISSNPHFCKSALSRFTPEDFLDWVRGANIPFEEREFGRLFCKGKASEILDLILGDCKGAGVTFMLDAGEIRVSKRSQGDFSIEMGKKRINAVSLVVATGGVSIPGAGASALGYTIAENFKIPVVPPRPGLVPFTLDPKDKDVLAPLSGIAVKARVVLGRAAFTENLLFTHRGLSGPVILQVSSHWEPGQAVAIDLLPDVDLLDIFDKAREKGSKKQVKTLLGDYLPKRLVAARISKKMANKPLCAIPKSQLAPLAAAFHAWMIKPCGTEGYRTAEVTVGGVDCNQISSKTMEARKVPGLYFIGEVLDVTGWLGGYNLHWAWASGYCAGQFV